MRNWVHRFHSFHNRQISLEEDTSSWSWPFKELNTFSCEFKKAVGKPDQAHIYVSKSYNSWNYKWFTLLHVIANLYDVIAGTQKLSRITVLDNLSLSSLLLMPQVRKYASLQAMRQQSHVDELGTLSFVTDLGKLYIKVPGGWREIQVNV